MEVIRPGTVVELGNDGGRVEGTVIEVSVAGRELRVMYNVAWWTGRERKTGWVDASEVVQRGDGEPVLIGFLNEMGN